MPPQVKNITENEYKSRVFAGIKAAQLSGRYLNRKTRGKQIKEKNYFIKYPAICSCILQDWTNEDICNVYSLHSRTIDNIRSWLKEVITWTHIEVEERIEYI